MKRVFQLPTNTHFETDISKLSTSVSQALSGADFCNNFHDWIIYKSPSPKSLGKVDDNTIFQDSEEITNIQFTSGTTGLPKAAALTHLNIINNAASLKEIVGYSPQDRICLTVPFYHCFGMVMGTLASMQGGCTLVLPWPTFNAQKSLESIEKWKCTMVYGVPTMFIEMIKVKQTGQFDIGSLYKSVIAGSICPKQLILDMEKHLGIKDTHIAYGMTETSPVSFMMRNDDPIEKRSTTVGRIFNNVEAKILSSEGEPVEIGEKGEFAVKGYLVMHGYYNDPENTAKSIKNGWMMSGDLGRFDEEGYLYIEGRIKDLIIRGGENISPKEIEEIIMELPQIENVQVIGVPDPKYQEEICALVKTKEGKTISKDEILDHLKPNLSHFKIPKYLQFVDSFPITVTGKPQKYLMVQQWIEQTESMTEEEIQKSFIIR